MRVFERCASLLPARTAPPPTPGFPPPGLRLALPVALLLHIARDFQRSAFILGHLRPFRPGCGPRQSSQRIPTPPGSRRLSTQEHLTPPRGTRRADLARSQPESHVRARPPAESRGLLSRHRCPALGARLLVARSTSNMLHRVTAFRANAMPAWPGGHGALHTAAPALFALWWSRSVLTWHRWYSLEHLVYWFLLVYRHG